MPSPSVRRLDRPANNYVVKHRYPQDFAADDQFLGHFYILFAGGRISGRMIVNEYNAGRPVNQDGSEYLPCTRRGEIGPTQGDHVAIY